MNYGLVSNSAVITGINTYYITSASAIAKKSGSAEACIIPGSPVGKCRKALALGITSGRSIKNEFAGVRPHMGITCFISPVN